MSGGRPKLTTPEAWAEAALLELDRAGVQALSVQSVARSLGVTKGGLYHHFADRRALLRAALAVWEARQVAELTARFESIAAPRERLHRLLTYAAVEMRPTVILQLLAAAADPDVAQTLERSSAERLALLRRIFTQLGAGRASAEHRAIVAYSHYLGLAQLRAHAPGVLASPARVRAHLRLLEATLLAGLDEGGHEAPGHNASDDRPAGYAPGMNDDNEESTEAPDAAAETQEETLDVARDTAEEHRKQEGRDEGRGEDLEGRLDSHADGDEPPPGSPEHDRGIVSGS